MHLKQSKEIDSHIDDMESPLDNLKVLTLQTLNVGQDSKKVGTKINSYLVVQERQ